MMEQFKRNLRQAFRVSYKHPGFTLIVVLTLALPPFQVTLTMYLSASCAGAIISGRIGTLITSPIRVGLPWITGSTSRHARPAPFCRA